LHFDILTGRVAALRNNVEMQDLTPGCYNAAVMPVDFKNAVVERSRSVPVVVDFWAPWCAPCRVLGPAIEALAAEAGGRWELVKLDTDEQPDIARAFGIMSIPTVKMFHGGRPIAEFIGALPPLEIRRWLDSHLPDSRLERLEAIVSRWESSGGRKIAPDLETFVKEHPDLPAGSLRLAQAVVADDPGRARELIRSAGAEVEQAELVADLTSLADLAESGDGAPERLAPHLEAARKCLREHDLDGALEHLIDGAMIDKSFGNELTRRAAVALFRLLGPDHELTGKHRSRLAMAVYS
jgi:putative thioredoxin